MKSKKKIVLITVAIVIAVTCGLALDQFILLQNAHSTFNNYYEFRGCTQLVSMATSSGVCRTASGATITIVEINGKWYLQGDGPGVW